MITPRRPAGAWRWAAVLRSPHRLGFLGGAVVLFMASLWWAWRVWVAGWGAGGMPLSWPASLVHAVVMGFGFLPLFFTGFLFTAGPRWLHVPAVSARMLLWPVSTLVLSWALFLWGAHVRPDIAALAVAAGALSWGWITWRLLQLLRSSEERDRFHVRLITWACASGALAWALVAAGLWQGELSWVRAAVGWGLWGFLMPVFVIAADRLMPVFSLVHLRWLGDRGVVLALLGVCLIKGGHASTRALGVDWPPVLVTSHAGLSSLAGVAVLGMAWHWSEVQNMRLRMLAMLNVGVLWLGLALMLPSGSLASVHALTMGFMGSVWLAMVSRVSSTHAGRSIAADQITWGLFWVMQLATGLRVAAALLPTMQQPLWMAAASLWLGVVGAWAWRHARWWGRA